MREQNKEFFDNASSVVGTAFQAWSRSMTIYISGDMGASGVVYVERRAADGSWKRYPSLTYVEADAWEIIVNSGCTLRVVVENCTSVDIEIY